MKIASKHFEMDRFFKINRRKALGTFVLGGALFPFVRAQNVKSKSNPSFRFCLNMSTIRGQALSVIEEIEIAGKAGYDSIEPWLGKLHEYVEGGGSMNDLRKRIEDFGMSVESAIGFSNWAVNDPEKRKKGLENVKRDMELLSKIGGKRIAAPPAGISSSDIVSPQSAAERYRVLLEIGDSIGVIPQIEMWGGHSSIGNLGTAIYIAIESGHPRACFLGDVFHIYKGASDFSGLALLSAHALQVFHINDYPAKPPRDQIGDRHRVFPTDGIAPLNQIFKIFKNIGANPVLSLELFNRDYWKMNPMIVAKTGLQKMKKAADLAEI